jgi:hypothetical protein
MTADRLEDPAFKSATASPERAKRSESAIWTEPGGGVRAEHVDAVLLLVAIRPTDWR